MQKVEKDEGKEDTIKLGVTQVVELGNKVLKHLGFATWEFKVSKTAKNVRVKARKEGESKKDEVVIPEDYSKGRKGVLRTIASGLGHVYRIEAKKNVLGSNLKILSRYHTSGVEVLGEGTDKYFASQALLAFGEEGGDEALPYAYAALKRKEKGGSFRDSFLESLEVRAGRLGKSLKQYLEEKSSEGLLERVGDVLRNWRRHTPLEENSPYLPTTEQLRYIEGELVTSKLLESEELWPLAFVSGLDLYTVCGLKQLGELDFSGVKKPDFSFVDSVVIPYFQEAEEGNKPD